MSKKSFLIGGIIGVVYLFLTLGLEALVGGCGFDFKKEMCGLITVTLNLPSALLVTTIYRGSNSIVQIILVALANFIVVGFIGVFISWIYNKIKQRN